jgi:protein TonB
VRKVVWSLGIADSQLVGRIERLVVAPTGSRSFPWLTMSVAVGVLLGFFVLRPASEAPPKPPVPAIRPPVQRTLAVSAQPLHIAAPSVRELVTLAPQPDNLALRQPHNDAPSATAVSHPRTSSSEPATQAKTNRASIDNKNKAAQPNDRSAKTGMPNAPPAHHHAKSPASAVPHLAGGVPVQTPPPLYPHWARERGREGSATVAFTVDTRGRVRNIRLLAVKGESAFGRAAADAVAKWRFKPFTVNGSPIAHKMTQLFEFQLKKEHRCMRVIGSRLCH